MDGASLLARDIDDEDNQVVSQLLGDHAPDVHQIEHSPIVLSWYRVMVTATTLLFGIPKAVAAYRNEGVLTNTMDVLGAILGGLA